MGVRREAGGGRRTSHNQSILQNVYFVNKITSFESFRELLNGKDLGGARISLVIVPAGSESGLYLPYDEAGT